MSIRRITLNGGPLDGKQYDVPLSTEHISADGGRYRITPKTGQWEPTKAAKPAQNRAPRARASKPKKTTPADAPVGDASAAPTVVENKTGKPETILTPTEFETASNEDAGEGKAEQ